ncbi:Mitochondrial oxaloacetate carrier protein [Lobosporangium transversale]|uniref:Mitochondrial carrier domain-containing protein n=1 Tax=Lobosporangium transversale TaxID=64571 RepID=A0A1Y2H1Q6_9FUNG|nr:mitochondrial carrier domain-containing protein [Lobosporangium transversale]KAF9908186.1 Mitochondrial oxaloacetate carrier protein [Lobosporangium transversale]ORZ28487.1 mitochondrial carrier domain-containing protein [Lobosporangium transversale]|eukprot:XP_021886172.1 mitochondrial carrier domain-containing protein [Lobosporangium transversale]
MNTFTTKSTPLLGGSNDNDSSAGSRPPSSLSKHGERIGAKRELTQLENFAISALAPSIAVLFTNPFDTVKVRLQLQGEFVRTREPGRNGKEIIRVSEKVYKSSLDCLVKTFRHEGIRGLQKGLFPAILKESSKNIFRLGLYDPILNTMHPLSYPGEASTAPAWKRMIAGATCGAMGAISANPFELIKTRLQSHSSSGLAVGNQYAYKGTFSALRTIIGTDGVMTLYRGSMISIARSMLGSAANLTTYSLIKDHARNNWDAQDGVILDMMSSLASAFVSVVVMNPMDVVRIRLYNRSSQSTSQSTLQSCRHILTTEGPLAFYKGFSTHFMRIGPHFTLTFVFLGMLKRQLIEGSTVSSKTPMKSSNILHPKDESPAVSSSSPSSSTPSLTAGVIARQEQI